MQSCNSHWNC